MAKIYSFNKEAPALKAQSSRTYARFELVARMEHTRFGDNRDVQSIRVLATRGLIVYERYFPSQFAFLAWLRPKVGSLDSGEISRGILNGNQVNIPIGYEEADLIPDGFKALIEE